MTMQKFAKGAAEQGLEFPVSNAYARGFRRAPSRLVSVREGKDHGVRLPADLCNDAALKASAGEIAEVRKEVVAGTFPRWFMEKYYPGDWGTFPEEIPEPLARAHETFNLAAPLSFDDPAGLARVVHMDNPTDLARILMDWLIDIGCRPKGSATDHFDFIETAVDSWMPVSLNRSRAAKEAFEMKYFFGVPRPEEVLGENITAYPEGAPNHPSFPAGHGAIAFADGLTFLDEWALYERTGETVTEKPLPDRVKQVVFDTCYIWAMARSLAGVHHAVDNLVFAFRRHAV